MVFIRRVNPFCNQMHRKFYSACSIQQQQGIILYKIRCVWVSRGEEATARRSVNLFRVNSDGLCVLATVLSCASVCVCVLVVDGCIPAVSRLYIRATLYL